MNPMLHVLPWRKSSRSNGNGGACVEVASLPWRKSSRSNGNGGNCVEAALPWRKSSRSNGNGGACVEVAGCSCEVVVRDSKLAHLDEFPVLTMSRDDWAGLVRTVAS